MDSALARATELRRPLLVAHRGGAPSEVDNSAAAFDHALTLDVDMFEFDVRRAGDGTLVLLHDPVVHAEGNRWVVQDTPYDALREFLPWLMTLDEYLERYGHARPFNLDLKTHGYEDDVIDALSRHNLTDHALISSGHTLSLRRIARRAPDVHLGLSRGHARTSVEFDAYFAAYERYMGIVLPRMLRLARAHAVMMHFESVEALLVKQLHQAGIRVFCWTVDDAATARALARMNVDGITSNQPELIRQGLSQP